jgi:hypothetical protein
MKILTHALPLWLEERGGKAVAIPERAAVVKRIFALAAAGYGRIRIAKRLREEGVNPFGRPLTEADVGAYSAHRQRAHKKAPTNAEVAVLRARVGELGRWLHGEWHGADWRPTYIGMVLTDRRALGEYTPGGRGREGAGEPIAGHYPAVVTEAEWAAARAEAGRRRVKLADGMHPQGGRVGERVELFSGLLKDARTGTSYFVETRNDEAGRRRVLRTAASTQGHGNAYTFPQPTFEAAVLSCLREIDPHEMLNGDPGPDESQVLAGELERVRQSIALIVAEMNERGESRVLFDRLRVKEEEEGRLSERLAQAQQKAA